MFKSTRNKGFQITFENGWTISVQFGWGNYCDNRNHPDGFDFTMKQDVVESSDAEIAIWDDKGEWYTFDNDDQVLGRCTPNDVAVWIDAVSKM